jgi:hypothetical protein
MKNMFLVGLFSLVCFGGKPMTSDYSILRISGKAISTNGQIDFRRWVNNDFDFCEPISIKLHGQGKYYETVGDYIFEVTTQKRRDELHLRFSVESNAGRDLAIIRRRVHYQGRMLKYAERVYASGRTMNIAGQSDDAIQGFRFKNYLIFLVKARYFGQFSYDFVVYNLTDDTYAVQRTFGVWPEVMIFSASEAVPDPRGKTEKP